MKYGRVCLILGKKKRWENENVATYWKEKKKKNKFNCKMSLQIWDITFIQIYLYNT